MLSLLLASLAGFAQSGQQAYHIALAKQYFAEAQVAAKADGGNLWGKVLATPMLLIDPDTREIYGSRADEQGQLKKQDGVWVGKLPDNLPVANFAFKWAGVRWTIIALSTVPRSLTERFELFMHESFHWFQPDLGLFVGSGPCAHLDTYDGRVWLRLEGRAMERALSETDPMAQPRHVRNALLFRSYRQSLFPDAHEKERLIELNEGLAQYTGVRLMGLPEVERVRFAARILGEWPSSRPSFARWHAYDLIPTYGLLLDIYKPDWNRKLTKDSDIVAIMATTLAWQPPSDLKRAAQSAAGQYGGSQIAMEERPREQERQKRIAELERKFVTGPVILLPLPARKSIGFKIDKLVELPSRGTVFSDVQLQDEWGKAVVEDGGVLIVPDMTRAYLAANGPSLTGPGWRLELQPGWELAPGKRAGDFEVRRKSVGTSRPSS